VKVETAEIYNHTTVFLSAPSKKWIHKVWMILCEAFIFI
jgi:hypothetical protein